MATSFEQNKNNIFNTRAPKEKLTSKIPTMNNSSINKRDPNYGLANIDRRTNKNNQKRTPVSTKSSQLSQSPVITHRSTKSVTQCHGSQSSWAVQPTEHANVKRQDVSSVNKSNETTKYISKPKRSFTKIQRKIQRVSPKEVDTPKPYMQYEPKFPIPQEEVSAYSIGGYTDEILMHDEPEHTAYYPRSEKPVFRLNSETMREIEALGDDKIHFIEKKQNVSPSSMLVSKDVLDETNKATTMNIAEESAISSLLLSRTEELLRSNRKTKRQRQTIKEIG